MKKLIYAMSIALMAGGFFAACGDGGDDGTQGNEKKSYTITTAAQPTNGGRVTGGGTFEENSTVKLVAVANQGYTFDHWQDGTTDATREITVTKDETYTATFITNSNPGGGNSGSVSVNFGGSSWTPGSLSAQYHSDNSQYWNYMIQAQATANQLPALVCFFDAGSGTATANYKQENNAMFDANGDEIARMQYMERTYFTNSNNVRYGDWAGKTATINYGSFDATNLVLTANVTATMMWMIYCDENGDPITTTNDNGQEVYQYAIQMDGVSYEDLTTKTLTVGISNVTLTNAKAANGEKKGQRNIRDIKEAK